MPCLAWGGPALRLSLIMWSGNKISRKLSQFRRSVIQEWRTARQMSGWEAAVGEKKRDQRVRAARRVAQLTSMAVCVSGSSPWLIDCLWSCRRRATAAFSWLCLVFFSAFAHFQRLTNLLAVCFPLYCYLASISVDRMKTVVFENCHAFIKCCL